MDKWTDERLDDWVRMVEKTLERIEKRIDDAANKAEALKRQNLQLAVAIFVPIVAVLLTYVFGAHA